MNMPLGEIPCSVCGKPAAWSVKDQRAVITYACNGHVGEFFVEGTEEVKPLV